MAFLAVVRANVIPPALLFSEVSLKRLLLTLPLLVFTACNDFGTSQSVCSEKTTIHPIWAVGTFAWLGAAKERSDVTAYVSEKGGRYVLEVKNALGETGSSSLQFCAQGERVFAEVKDELGLNVIELEQGKEAVHGYYLKVEEKALSDAKISFVKRGSFLDIDNSSTSLLPLIKRKAGKPDLYFVPAK